MIKLATRAMELGQRRGEIPQDRDARFIAAMIIGGMRRVLAIALATDPPIPQETDRPEAVGPQRGDHGRRPGRLRPRARHPTKYHGKAALMDFEISDRAKDVRERLLAFMDERIYPAEPVWAAQMSEAGHRARAAARGRGAQGGGQAPRPVEPVPP